MLTKNEAKRRLAAAGLRRTAVSTAADNSLQRERLRRPDDAGRTCHAIVFQEKLSGATIGDGLDKSILIGLSKRRSWYRFWQAGFCRAVLCAAG